LQKGSDWTAQTSLKAGQPSLGCLIPLGQRRTRRVLERALEVLAPMLVKLGERQLDDSAKLLVVGCSKRIQERPFFVVNVAAAARHPSVDQASFDRATRRSTASRSRIRK
jgi:hypothetical protein